MKYERHNPRNVDAPLDACIQGDVGIRDLHSLGSCLFISFMCHVLLVLFATGYDLDGSHPRGGGTSRVAVRLQRAASKGQAAADAEHLASATQIPSVAESARPGTAEVTADALATGREENAGESTDLSAYVPVEMLSIKPRFLSSADEILPPRLGADEGGRVVIQLLVNTDGGIDTVTIESSELSLVGTRRFIQHLGNLRLEPGQINGNPVKARWRLEFTVIPGLITQSAP